jgi:hypothetical protein
VTTNAVLTQNLTCPASSGVIVGAAGITIDLKGFTLTGDRSPNHYGVLDGSYSRVKVENGVVRNFYDGVDAGSSANTVTVSNVVASGSVLAGIFICCASASSLINSSTVSGNGGDGIIVGGVSARIQSSNASGNGGHGIEISGGFASIRSSTASGNGNTIGVVGSSAAIKGNLTDANGFPTDVSDGAGPGIGVVGYTVAPAGTNVAHGNDDPSECSPTLLC